MNKKNNRLLLATAILLALGAGFGLARLMGTPGPDSTDQHAQADDHSDEGEGDGHAGGPEGEGAEGRCAVATSKPKGKAGGKKAARTIKFTDGQGGTWSGIGKRPNWFKAALAAGTTADDLRVRPAA